MTEPAKYETMDVRQASLTALEAFAQSDDAFGLVEKVCRIKPGSNPQGRDIGIPMKSPETDSLRAAVGILAKLESVEPQEAEKAAAKLICGAIDLQIRNQLRASAMVNLEGPEKAIAKAVQSAMDLLGMTESDARAFVVAQRQKNGLPV